MCGIVGYVGDERAAPLIVDALKKLEYRGYDSFGVTVNTGTLSTKKFEGRIIKNEKKVVSMSGTIGIGHTRWATHGEPSDINAHPHTDCNNTISVVHNGIIENYTALKQKLSKKHTFLSETDSEVIPHLIEDYYGKTHNLLKAVKQTVKDLKGSYAFLVVSSDSDMIIGVRNRSPLVIGYGWDGVMLSSDIAPMIGESHYVLYMEDGDIALASRSGVVIHTEDGIVERPMEPIPSAMKPVDKGGYHDFMLKEIHEIPFLAERLLSIRFGTPIGEIDSDGVMVLGCGSSYYAGLAFKYMMNDYFSLPIRVEMASEFIHSPNPLPKYVVAISQSGETADTLSSTNYAKKCGAYILSLVNSERSTLERMSDYAIQMDIGKEIGVAASKSFAAELILLYDIIKSFDRDYSLNRFDDTCGIERELSAVMNTPLLDSAVSILKRCDDTFFIGKNVWYPIALEGALKLKEISYIHAEGFAAGELKHGPFAMLTDKTPVVAICMNDKTYGSMVSSIKEIKSRKSPLIVISDHPDPDLIGAADVILQVKSSSYIGKILCVSVLLQLLAYHTAKSLGKDVDKPRNLAKSVTVE
jgi:glutamine---fructose-6-phosphate transaminase (isomerizing)